MQKLARWPAALAATAVLVVALLAAMGWLLFRQEQSLDRERQRERLENALSLVLRESERALAQASADESTSLSLRFDGRGIVRTAGVPLPWQPVVPAPKEAPAAVFAAGEQLEFAQAQPKAAIEAYRLLLERADPSIRAGALLRIARCQRALKQPAEAMETHRRLAALGIVSVAGAPAEIIALHERAALLEETGNSAAASREREALKAVLEQGKYAIDRPTWEFYASGLSIKPESTAWARAVEQLWQRVAESPKGIAILPVDIPGAPAHRFVADWNREGSEGTARLVDCATLAPRMQRTLEASAIFWSLLFPGDPAAAPTGTSSATLTRSSNETGLPWGVAVTLLPESPSSRFSLLAGGLVLLGIVILGTLYLAYRAIRRELRVAAMQSDFVAAVSHEFRTPITALTHLTDMLESGDAAENRKPLYYKALSRETRRLREMVENLLDFGRVEAGRYKYKPEEVNAAEFIEALIEDFREQPAAASHEVRFEAGSREIRMAIDREAIRRAFWNLLDNSARYSPVGTRITAKVSQENGWALLSVRDEGPGIPRDEHKRIFQKFVRGRAASSQAVKGTGIGLAMVDAIVRAHGGRVKLESEPGAGSRFTILLPTEGRT